MKYKNKQEKLKARIKHWESSAAIKQGNSSSPGTYKKPGSQKGR